MGHSIWVPRSGKPPEISSENHYSHHYSHQSRYTRTPPPRGCPRRRPALSLEGCTELSNVLGVHPCVRGDGWERQRSTSNTRGPVTGSGGRAPVGGWGSILRNLGGRCFLLGDGRGYSCGDGETRPVEIFADLRSELTKSGNRVRVTVEGLRGRAGGSTQMARGAARGRRARLPMRA